MVMEATHIGLTENIVADVLFNADLLAIICRNLWDNVKTDGCPLGPNGSRVHPLLSLALTCQAVSSLALDTLWRDIQEYGFQPILRIFPSAASGSLQVLPEEIPDETWVRFRQYASRIRYIAFDPTSCARFSSTIFLRLAEYQNPIFPKLQCLRSDVSFVASPSILLFLPTKTLNEIQLTFSPSTDVTTPSACIRTIKWQVPALQTLYICCPEFDNGQYRATSFTNLASLKGLRALTIKSHLVDYDALVQLSAFNNLEHLCVKTTSNIPSDSRQAQGGFPSLKSLHITAKVSEMPRILRLVRQGTLETLTFVDTSGEAFRTNSEFMMDFYRELLARFPLHNLSLTYYRAAQLDRALWASSRAVFEPLYELHRLRSIQFVGELALDDETIKTRLAPAWPHIELISIPQLSGNIPSCAMLSVLARCCPRLVLLSMPFEFPSDGGALPEDVLSHRLQTLKSVNTTTKKPALIARFLDRIFPFLVRVEGGSGWSEVDSILRHVCQPIRWDQHQRERGQSKEHQK
ncbi:uncharacterized protein BT62DRAFT_936469 [Guyanagaster necrorhizus]|uniref:F-box domain-containing protein n=1 Tax=Guyanagaster necrorhizus TaxID=856835 RepID=A0A9P8ANQ8_9AGAR|nr:uncharacterized protein BT62DRAFT_936469 [Guyanagaster necrorhizus MCA 3950]KAG7442114.1 hypothetical protein BT62DRAFT_936469 [Guyanagaster necrorhizus MCA 3950]